MKIILTSLLLLLGHVLFAQHKSYNIYEIGKGEIFIKDYFYLDHFANNLLIAVPLRDGINYENADLTGVINLNEKIILPFQYRNIEKVRDDYNLYKENIPLLAISDGGGRALFRLNNSKFEQITDFKYLKFRPYLFDGNYLMAYNGYCQILNLKDTAIIKTKFVELEPLTSNLISTKDMNYKWGVMNIKGDTILSNQFTSIRKLSDSLALVKNRDSVGVVNNNGELIIPPIFSRIETSKNRILAQTFNNGKRIEISENLQKQFSDWIATIEKNGKIQSIIYSINNKNILQIGLFGAFDLKGNLKIPFEYDLLKKGVNNEIIAYKNGKVGVISEDGNTIIDFKYDKITLLFDIYYLVENDYGQGLLTSKNKKILEIKAQQIFAISNSEVLHKENNIWSKISYSNNFKKSKVQKTKLKSDYSFSYLQTFSPSENDYVNNTSFFGISDYRRYGVIDVNQNLIIPIDNEKEPRYFNGKYFDLERKYTAKGVELFDIDLSKNYYDDSLNFKNTLIVKKNEKYGVINMEGKTVIPFQYSYIQNIDGKKFIVEK